MRVRITVVIQLLLMTISIPLFFTACGGTDGKGVEKPHILLITIDTLRRDHLGAYGYPRETSPFIDRLAKNGTMFRHVVAPVPLTAPNHATILSSLHPLVHNLKMNGRTLKKKIRTIAEILKKDGYYTIGTVAIELLSGNYGFSQGFDSFSDKWKKEPVTYSKFPHLERTAKAVNKSLFKQIDQYASSHKDKPLFIWVHYFDPHGPYYRHQDITFSKPLPKGKVGIANRYDKEIRYTDNSIRKLHEYLQQKGLTEKMVTCITADHGEQLGEHGYTAGHPDFYSEDTFVPLIIHGKGIPSNKIVDTYVSSMDVGVTLLGRAGINFGYPVNGINLLEKRTKLGDYKKRKQLIIGNPVYARSLQLLWEKRAFILNFDYHYKYWFISDQTRIDIPNDRYKTIPRRQMIKKGNKRILKIPTKRVKGKKFLVFRMDIENNKGLSVKLQVDPSIFTGGKKLPADLKQVEIIAPVTMRDSFKIYFSAKKETQFKNIRYAFITYRELPKKTDFLFTVKSKIYDGLLTPRTKTKIDELYDLATDLAMEENLFREPKYKPTIIKTRKMIYAAYQFYLEKRSRFFKGKTTQADLSERDKKILESLGYL